MVRIIILGTANSIADHEHENTHLAVLSEEHTILVDCVGSPIVRLRQAKIEPLSLTDLILTHFHPDHVASVPLLLMDLWLLGRKQPLNIYGLLVTIQKMQEIMHLYQWDSWPNFFPVSFHPLPAEELTPVMQASDVTVLSSPVCHLIPTIGIRIESPSNGKTFAYSCDTSPCEQVVRLAKGVDVLIHEATGASPGHTSPGQAGEIATQAGAKSLYLIHYPVENFDPQAWEDEAQQNFSGPVRLAKDFMCIDR